MAVSAVSHVSRRVPVLLRQRDSAQCVREEKHTSFKGRVMGLPMGSPLGVAWPATRPAKRAMMAVLENMLAVVGIM